MIWDTLSLFILHKMLKLGDPLSEKHGLERKTAHSAITLKMEVRMRQRSVTEQGLILKAGSKT